jgi:hypothetical protein
VCVSCVSYVGRKINVFASLAASEMNVQKNAQPPPAFAIRSLFLRRTRRNGW